MDQSGFGLKLLSIVAIFLVFCSSSIKAQSSNDSFEKLSLIDATGINREETVQFNFKFETESMNVEGQVESFMENYDSIAITSYDFIEQKGEKILKINAFVINKENNKRLKWVAAVDYIENPKEQLYTETKKSISGKFIQFGAFNVYGNATRELAALVGFEILMIKVNDQYKLISPYKKGDYTRAKEKYAEKDVWVAVYDNKEVISIEADQ